MSPLFLLYVKIKYVGCKNKTIGLTGLVNPMVWRKLELDITQDSILNVQNSNSYINKYHLYNSKILKKFQIMLTIGGISSEFMKQDMKSDVKKLLQTVQNIFPTPKY